MTGKNLSDLLAAGCHPALAAMPLKFVLAPTDRAVLHQAVEQRFDYADIPCNQACFVLQWVPGFVLAGNNNYNISFEGGDS